MFPKRFQQRFLQAELSDIMKSRGQEFLQSPLRRGNSAWKQQNWEKGERSEDMTDKNYLFFFFFFLHLINPLILAFLSKVSENSSLSLVTEVTLQTR